MPPPTKQNVLDLEARRSLFELVQERPGIHLRAIAEVAGQAISTSEYHLHQLVKFGLLDTREAGGVKAFFPPEIDRRDKDLLYVVRHEAPRRICAHLLLEPQASPADLKVALGIPAPTLSFHLKKLLKNGITAEEKRGRSKALTIVDPERVGSVLVTYRATFLDEAIDRFAETWLALR
jgi:predicted transcriptional regulator